MYIYTFKRGLRGELNYSGLPNKKLETPLREREGGIERWDYIGIGSGTGFKGSTVGKSEIGSEALEPIRSLVRQILFGFDSSA